MLVAEWLTLILHSMAWGTIRVDPHVIPLRKSLVGGVSPGIYNTSTYPSARIELDMSVMNIKRLFVGLQLRGLRSSSSSRVVTWVSIFCGTALSSPSIGNAGCSTFGSLIVRGTVTQTAGQEHFRVTLENLLWSQGSWLKDSQEKDW